MRKAEGLHWSSLEQGVAPTRVIRPAAEGGEDNLCLTLVITVGSHFQLSELSVI